MYIINISISQPHASEDTTYFIISLFSSGDLLAKYTNLTLTLVILCDPQALRGQTGPSSGGQSQRLVFIPTQSE